MGKCKKYFTVEVRIFFLEYRRHLQHLSVLLFNIIKVRENGNLTQIVLIPIMNEKGTSGKKVWSPS